jgi:hypothetical protein
MRRLDESWSHEAANPDNQDEIVRATFALADDEGALEEIDPAKVFDSGDRSDGIRFSVRNATKQKCQSDFCFQLM